MEQRRFVRAGLPCKVIVRADHTLSTYTENIGSGGVGVVLYEELDIASSVGLEIYLGKDVVACEGRIVWVLEKWQSWQEALSHFDTGVEFTRIKEDDRQLISNFVQGSVSSKQ